MADQAARLLAHPLRHRLLFEYEEPSSPSKVARRIKERVNVVSYHTKVLHDHGWIELVRTERRRGATEHYYRSTHAPDIEDAEWDQTPLPLRHSIILGMQGITHDEAHAAALHGGFDWARAHFSRSLLDLDEQGGAEVAATLRELMDRLQAIATASRERDAAERTRHEVVIQYFRVPPRD